MTWMLGGPGGAEVVRGADAETLANDQVAISLLADASDTHGALSTHNVALRAGSDGAGPHRHSRSSELFYVLDGSLDLLAGDEVPSVTAGDIVVVPPGLPHAFGATRGRDGEVLIVITPGVERFEYFRHLARVAVAQEPRDSLLAVEELYDTYFVDSGAWQLARS